jgi:hypothetical protein
MIHTTEHLYTLLPAVYRIRDAEHAEALKALLGVMAREIGIVENDIAQLYANWFIETCAEWVVPYIGDLLGVRNLHQLTTTGFTQRAYVANTLRYRRRKGTATVLEQLARDTTLWPARAVEFFELLGTTQYINHLRPHNVRTPDLRQTSALALLDTPFDRIAHTADVRRIATGRGKHNIPNVGIFLWRLQPYYVVRTTPCAVPNPPAGRFTFHPLGLDAPLFNRPQTEESITHLAEEINVPGVLRRRALYDDLEAYRRALTSGEGTPITRYFSQQQPVLELYFDQPCTSASDCNPLPPEAIVICDLSGWDTPGWEAPQRQSLTKKFPAPGENPTFETQVAVDPVLGRLALLQDITSPPTKIEVSYAYGFSGDLGGGPYDRRPAPRPDAPPLSVYENSLAAPQAFDALIRVPSTGINTLGDALAAWNAATRQTVIQIDDSRTYVEDLTVNMTDTDLVLQAANFQRPTLVGNLTITGSQKGRLALHGLLIAGSVTVEDTDSLRQLDLVHCTLVPGVTLNAQGMPQQPYQPSLVVRAENDALRVSIDHSITGPVHLPIDTAGLHVQDSIIESPVRGQPATITPALVSGNLNPFPTLGSAPLRLNVTIDSDGPYTVTLPATPTTLAQARSGLQEAMRAAHESPAFSHAQVLSANNRLIVVPGVPGAVAVEAIVNAHGTVQDNTAALLRFSSGHSQSVFAMVSGVLSPFPTLSATPPSLTVTMGANTRVATLSAAPVSLAQARTRLQEAIRVADPTDPAFAGAIVGSSSDENRLVLVPGNADTALRFGATATDATTLAELGLETDVPAIAADSSGVRPGPPAILERLTVLGPTHVKELSLASAVIFGGLVRTLRRQTGCVRFSYVPDGSRTPRQYRCQPDLAINTAIAEAAEKTAGPLPPGEEDAIRRRLLQRLMPAFTSTRYGHPAYGQLSLTCPEEITTGAEDGSEMGVFSFLQQPQRAAHLRAGLDEYLRFGLEAGVFYVT